MKPPYSGISTPLLSPTIGGNFDAHTFLQNIQETERESQIQKDNLAAKNRQSYQKNFDPNKLYPKDIYSHNEKAIGQAVNDLIDLQIEGAKLGYDKDNSKMTPEFQKGVAEKQNRLNTLVQVGKENQKIMEMYQKEVSLNPDKYDIEDFYKFQDGMKDIEDPVELNKYLKTNSPINEKIDLYDVFKPFIPKEEIIESGVTTTTGLNRDAVRKSVENRYLSFPPEQRKNMLDTVLGLEGADGKPLATDLNSAIDAVTDMMMTTGSKKVSQDEPKNSGGSSGDGGYSNTKDSLYVVGWDANNTKPTRVSFLHTKSDPIRVDLVGNDGELRGYSLVSADFNEATQRWEITAEKPVNGKWETEVITNFDGSPTSKDTHNYEALSKIMGGDFVDLAYKQPKKGGTVKPSGSKPSQQSGFNQNIDPN